MIERSGNDARAGSHPPPIMTTHVVSSVSGRSASEDVWPAPDDWTFLDDDDVIGFFDGACTPGVLSGERSGRRRGGGRSKDFEIDSHKLHCDVTAHGSGHHHRPRYPRVYSVIQ